MGVTASLRLSSSMSSRNVNVHALADSSEAIVQKPAALLPSMHFRGGTNPELGRNEASGGSGYVS